VSPAPLPTPEDLGESPELAAVALLDHTLAVARAALLAEHGELGDPELGERPPCRVLPSTWLAWSLVGLADILHALVDDYRRAVDRERDGRHDDVSRREP